MLCNTDLNILNSILNSIDIFPWYSYGFESINSIPQWVNGISTGVRMKSV